MKHTSVGQLLLVGVQGLELGVDEAKVDQALEDFRTAKHDEFAQKLADELGIDVEKVKDALPDRP